MKPIAMFVVSWWMLPVAPAQTAPAAEKGNPPGAQAAPAVQPEALTHLKAADAAVKKLKLVRYDAVLVRKGAAESRGPSGEGTVVAERTGKDKEQKYRIEFRGRRAGGDEQLEFTVGSDGRTYFLVRPNTKTVHVDEDPAVVGREGRAAQGLMLRELVLEKPFDDELAGQRVELRGTTKVGDVECVEVYVKYAGDFGEALWAIGGTDGLPRRLTRYFKTPDGEPGSIELTIANLTLDPKFAADPFKPQIPEGYTRTDEFAP
jgi:outer membrane lipoprotein-sorting protein